MKNESVMCMDIHVTHEYSNKDDLHRRRPETFRGREMRVIYPATVEHGFRR